MSSLHHRCTSSCELTRRSVWHVVVAGHPTLHLWQDQGRRLCKSSYPNRLDSPAPHPLPIPRGLTLHVACCPPQVSYELNGRVDPSQLSKAGVKAQDVEKHIAFNMELVREGLDHGM